MIKINLKNFFLLCAGLTLFSLLGIQIKNIHYYYVKHLDIFNRANIYINSPICTNSELRSSLGEYSKCKESEDKLKISPLTLAWYDFLEDMFICGHGRCDKLWDELSTKLPYMLFFMGGVMLWVGWNNFQHRADLRAFYAYQLPLQHPRRFSLGPETSYDRQHID